jgi:hypothetical protein
MIPTVALAMRAAFAAVPGAFFSCCLVFALWPPIGTAAANEVTDWNVIIEQTAKASSVKPGVILSGRNVSLMHLAMHDALNSISRRYDPYGVHRSSPDANPRAAVMAAGRGVAVRLYPDQASSLDNLYSKMLLTIPDEPGKNEGLVLGDEVAAKIVALRADDRFDYATPTGEPFVSGSGPYGSGPGAWRPAPDSPHQNAIFPRASLVTPLALTSPSQFRNLLPGPLKLSSGKYSRELKEVRTLAGKASTVRTSEQTTIAMLWADPSMFRVFNEIARNLISERNDDLWESNRTLALLNVAMADSYVAVFEAKYHYQFWRPTMAIRWADGNEKTTSDSWLPLLFTPPFPEYPSGHSAACGSAQIILESAFGRSTPYAATSILLPGYSRNFTSFDEASRECVEGRMLSGAHFRFSDEDALHLGQHISRYALRNMLAAP